MEARRVYYGSAYHENGCNVHYSNDLPGNTFTLAEQRFEMLTAMRHRFATTGLDKISGLGCLLRPRLIPAYDETRLWRRCLSSSGVTSENGVQD
ncbi:hypothetical protein JB92DRAFT_2992577 [Gautieria morchelliformis]|nr:hypothetical protein JB92DRAFT_2992577 [Gautieria morchelliformis]